MSEGNRCRRCKGDDPRFCVKCVGEISDDAGFRAIVSEFVDASQQMAGSNPERVSHKDTEKRFEESLLRVKKLLGKE